MIQRRLALAGGTLGALHRQRVGGLPDLSALVLDEVPGLRLDKARATWRERVRAELRNVQLLTRFLGEVLGAGDPLDAYAPIAVLIADKIAVTERYAAVCDVLGAPALLPEPVALQDSPAFLASPMAERALASAITYFAVNEPIAAGYRADLTARCRNPAIKAVFEEPSKDHRDLGWSYIRQARRRFPSGTGPDWRALVALALEPHESAAARAMQEVPANLQNVAVWPEPELADLGLLSRERQALVYHRIWVDDVKPVLVDLDLLPRRAPSYGI